MVYGDNGVYPDYEIHTSDSTISGENVGMKLVNPDPEDQGRPNPEGGAEWPPYGDDPRDALEPHSVLDHSDEGVGL